MTTTPIEVRMVLRAELPAVARVRVASWRVAYAGLIPDSELAAIGEPGHLDAWVERMGASTESSTLIALLDGEVIGFAAYGAERSELAPAAAGRGEVYALYVHPDQWGLGAGHALMTAARTALRARGHDAVSIWVLEGNARGIAFYRRQGFEPTGDVTESRIDALPEARYVRPV